jgi:hypothetical protein
MEGVKLNATSPGSYSLSCLVLSVLDLYILLLKNYNSLQMDYRETEYDKCE